MTTIEKNAELKKAQENELLELSTRGDLNAIDLFINKNKASLDINEVLITLFRSDNFKVTKHLLENHNANIDTRDHVLISESCYAQNNDFAKYLLNSPTLKEHAEPIRAFNASIVCENYEMIEYVIVTDNKAIREVMKEKASGLRLILPTYIYAQKILDKVDLANNLQHELNNNEIKMKKQKI